MLARFKSFNRVSRYIYINPARVDYLEAEAELRTALVVNGLVVWVAEPVEEVVKKLDLALRSSPEN